MIFTQATIPQAARDLKVAEHSLRYQIKVLRIEPIGRVGPTLVYSADDLERAVRAIDFLQMKGGTPCP